jgi:hypothetical protein
LLLKFSGELPKLAFQDVANCRGNTAMSPNLFFCRIFHQLDDLSKELSASPINISSEFRSHFIMQEKYIHVISTKTYQAEISYFPDTK